MANPDYQFDEYTEQFAARTLAEVRQFARENTLPDSVTLEIGSNRGRFLSQLATSQPDQHHIGVELRLKYTRLAIRDHEKLDIKNTDFLCADVNLVLPILFDDGQIDDVYILFPDPWWKKRHAKRRLLKPQFLDMLSKKMSVGGSVWIRTDVGPLADEMRRALIEHENFQPLAPDAYPVQSFLRSTRERTVIESGMPINLVYYQNRPAQK